MDTDLPSLGDEFPKSFVRIPILRSTIAKLHRFFELLDAHSRNFANTFVGVRQELLPNCNRRRVVDQLKRSEGGFAHFLGLSAPLARGMPLSATSAMTPSAP